MKDSMCDNGHHRVRVAPGTYCQAPCWIVDRFQVHLAETVPVGHSHTHKQAHEYTVHTHIHTHTLSLFFYCFLAQYLFFLNGNLTCTQTHFTGLNYLNWQDD